MGGRVSEVGLLAVKFGNLQKPDVRIIHIASDKTENNGALLSSTMVTNLMMDEAIEILEDSGYVNTEHLSFCGYSGGGKKALEYGAYVMTRDKNPYCPQSVVLVSTTWSDKKATAEWAGELSEAGVPIIASYLTSDVQDTKDFANENIRNSLYGDPIVVDSNVGHGGAPWAIFTEDKNEDGKGNKKSDLFEIMEQAIQENKKK